MSLEKGIMAYLPVGVVASMILAAVWINASMSAINTSVLILSSDVKHANELNDLRFSAVEKRTLAIESEKGSQKAALEWIVNFRAMNPDLRTPDIPRTR